jgi:hypothetical protein
MVKLIMAKLNYTKLNHGLNIFQFFNFYLSNVFKFLFWQVKLSDFILFRIFFKKCKFY